MHKAVWSLNTSSRKMLCAVKMCWKKMAKMCDILILLQCLWCVLERKEDWWKMAVGKQNVINWLLNMARINYIPMTIQKPSGTDRPSALVAESTLEGFVWVTFFLMTCTPQKARFPSYFQNTLSVVYKVNKHKHHICVCTKHPHHLKISKSGQRRQQLR